MKILSTYKVKIKTYNHIFRGTVEVYRHAVDFLIDVCLKEWVEIKKIDLSGSSMKRWKRPKNKKKNKRRDGTARSWDQED